jgi:hypothetical protein
MITQEQFDDLNARYNETRLGAHGIASRLKYDNGVIYDDWFFPNLKEVTPENIEERICGTARHLSFYNSVITQAEEFYQLSQKAKEYCAEMKFIHRDMVYLPDYHSLVDRLDITKKALNSETDIFLRHLEILEFFQTYLKRTLEVYMFMPVSFSGHLQESVEKMEKSGEIETITEDLNLSESELQQYKDLHDKRYCKLQSLTVFRTTEKLQASYPEKFSTVLDFDSWDFYTGNCLDPTDEKGQYGHDLMRFTTEIEHFNPEDPDKQYFVYFK